MNLRLYAFLAILQKNAVCLGPRTTLENQESRAVVIVGGSGGHFAPWWTFGNMRRHFQLLQPGRGGAPGT